MLSLGLALGATVWGVGCAKGSGGDDDPPVTSEDASADGPVSQTEAGAGDDAPGTTGEDATTGEDSPTSGDDDDGDATTGEDSPTTGGDANPPGDDAGPGEDSGPTPDAGHDAGVDAGVDSGPGTVDAGHDAGIDSGPGTVDAGHDAGHDAGVDAGPCSPALQTGCPSGEACSLGNGGTPTCITPGPVGTGGLCTTQTCAADNLCADDGTHDQCRQFCSTDANCTQAAAPAGSTSEPNNGPHCVIEITDTTPTQDVCTVPCNPVAAAGTSGCATGLSCVYTGTDTIPEITDCETPGTVAKGGTCSTSATATLAEQCAGQLVCVVTSSTATSGTCRSVCKANNNNDCANGTTCEEPSGVTNPMFGFCCPTSGC